MGISSASVVAFLDALETKAGGPHSFMLLRHGRVAAEGWWAPYAPHIPHSLFSLSKSFASTADGFAVSEGLLTVDDPVVSFFPDSLPTTIPENMAAMRVRHLLSMSTGHDKDATDGTTAAPDGDWVRAFLALPVEHAPGTKFAYNSAATYMCSAIVQSLTGRTLLDYLTPRLFDPLGIESPTWESCPNGINIGGWGLSVKTEDIARFGQCYLKKGMWNGRQVVPAAWVSEATTKQVSNGEGNDSDWTQGYGYHFWRCRHNAFRGDGAFGQFCVVMPEQDVVLAITAGCPDLQAALDAAWDHLLPGIQPESIVSASSDLPRRIAGLTVPVPSGCPASAISSRISGNTYRLDPNDYGLHSATFTFAPDSGAASMSGEDGEWSIAGGHNSWTAGVAPMPRRLTRKAPPPVVKTAARGAWTTEDTYTMTVCYVETPFVETISYRFTGQDVAITRQLSAGFDQTELTAITGHTE